ncbi:rRNA maturation RNase YbeY [Spiroplasma platyhelix]|uniref:Endoribonuclease YbeY n=1 Tax=Spiroplasma platyhelix PALS-1 TaxID=1276218 RepID=A0A846TPR3_9MOLU|nr:rRNA maturation RNase YbeY [Spiroplasma platyhelix]MBE4703897.1 Endoribonuclease YbeY [Spiroplasma platyhelix PALS-1]NKE38270.1 rRNA maturation RNase YbeY [Spiroplasma platyhelix PALS-1]UJB29155.1 16S rRNA maturation RNase YbeY [Spiroplasma platyhelix PALS-1]
MSNQVNVFNEQNYALENFPNFALSILNQTLVTIKNQHANSEVAVVFIDEAKSLELNQTYRKKDYVADVLSFSNKDEKDLVEEESNDLGDVFICYPKAKKQAEEYQHSLTRELSFLFLHGLLHNLGYDHENKVDEEVMFGLQKRILNELKIYRN